MSTAFALSMYAGSFRIALFTTRVHASNAYTVLIVKVSVDGVKEGRLVRCFSAFSVNPGLFPKRNDKSLDQQHEHECFVTDLSYVVL